MPSIDDVQAKIADLLGQATLTLFTQKQFEAATRQALLAMQHQFPNVKEDEITAVAGHVQDISAITDLYKVMEVRYPYTDPFSFSVLPRFYVTYPDGVATITLPVQLAAGEIFGIRYSALHTIDDLDSAAALTFPPAYLEMFTFAVISYCALAKSAELITQYGTKSNEVKNWEDKAFLYMDRFLFFVNSFRQNSNPLPDAPAFDLGEGRY
jgi:hypothetical protein